MGARRCCASVTYSAGTVGKWLMTTVPCCCAAALAMALSAVAAHPWRIVISPVRNAGQSASQARPRRQKPPTPLLCDAEGAPRDVVLAKVLIWCSSAPTASLLFCRLESRAFTASTLAFKSTARFCKLLSTVLRCVFNCQGLRLQAGVHRLLDTVNRVVQCQRFSAAGRLSDPAAAAPPAAYVVPWSGPTA